MSLLTATRDFRGDADLRRWKKLSRTLDEMSEAIAVESKSLRLLVDNVSANIAFAFEAMENGETAPRLSIKIGGLEASLARHTKQLSLLKEQAELVVQVKENIIQLLAAPSDNAPKTFDFMSLAEAR